MRHYPGGQHYDCRGYYDITANDWGAVKQPFIDSWIRDDEIVRVKWHQDSFEYIKKFRQIQGLRVRDIRDMISTLLPKNLWIYIDCGQGKGKGSMESSDQCGWNGWKKVRSYSPKQGDWIAVRW